MSTRRGTRWTEEDLALLRLMCAADMALEDIAKQLRRSILAVRARITAIEDAQHVKRVLADLDRLCDWNKKLRTTDEAPVVYS